jgi:hypothetical protein
MQLNFRFGLLNRMLMGPFFIHIISYYYSVVYNFAKYLNCHYFTNAFCFLCSKSTTEW